MEKILDDFDREFQKLVDDSAKQTATECVQKLRSSSPKRPGGGAYARSWTKKQEGKGWIVYNAKHYQLTHLLENSHVIRNKKGTYGRTSPGHGQIIHIAPVEQYGIQEFPLKISRGLS